jgi:hypothetical protein
VAVGLSDARELHLIHALERFKFVFGSALHEVTDCPTELLIVGRK